MFCGERSWFHEIQGVTSTLFQKCALDRIDGANTHHGERSAGATMVSL